MLSFHPDCRADVLEFAKLLKILLHLEELNPAYVNQIVRIFTIKTIILFARKELVQIFA
jgi:hypothetical protein